MPQKLLHKNLAIASIATGVTISFGAVLGGFFASVGDFKTIDSVRTDVDVIAEQVKERIKGAGPAGLDKPIADFLSDVATTSPDTSIYVSGSYNSGYCLIGFNENSDNTADGIKSTVKAGYDSLYDDFSCSYNLSEMSLVAGPGDGKVAGGADYEESSLESVAKEPFAYFGLLALGIPALLGGASSLEKISRRNSMDSEDGTDELESGVSSVSENTPTKESVNSRKTSAPHSSNLLHRFKDIKAEWVKYELDLMNLLEYPTVTDLSVPATRDFHKALYRANMLAPKDVKTTMPAVDAERFEDAVVDLEYKLQLMLNEAKRLKWNAYSPLEQASLRTAQNLLAIALNSASSENERQIAYKRLVKEIEGIIVVPEKAMMELEARIAPSIMVSGLIGNIANASVQS